MLKQLNGQTHQVLTGVQILYKQERVEFVEKTDVTFTKLDSETMNACKV
jgi:predicted house-cleaning NTP pyrophosphatase (Maf/HAM1 superfamily)